MTEPASEGGAGSDPSMMRTTCHLDGNHWVVTIDNLRVPADQMLGQSGEGFRYAQIRLAPARLSHCMRWLGACIRANEIATDYACRRQAFGKVLIDHERVGFMLAENLIDLRQSALMIDWCAGVLRIILEWARDRGMHAI